MFKAIVGTSTCQCYCVCSAGNNQHRSQGVYCLPGISNKLIQFEIDKFQKIAIFFMFIYIGWSTTENS